MPVKRYEVDGNPYDVSDAKEQEFLSKFSNAVFIGVLDEEGIVVEQEIKDETQDFPTSAAADADVVQPMTASQAGVTESLSEDTSSDSQEDSEVTLEQFKTMTADEKKQLSYSDRQRLPRELYREKQSKDNIDFIDFSSEDFNKLENEEKVKLKEIAGKKIIEDYNSKGIIDFKVSDEELDNKAKELLKEKNKPGLIKSYAAQTARGFSNFAKGTIDFLDMTKFSILEAGLEVFGDDYEGTADDKEAIMRVVKSGTIGPMGSPRSLDFQTFTEKLDPYIRKYENQNIVDDIAEGNYLLAGERAVGASLESLPSIVAAGLGLGGLIVLGGSSAGGKFEEEFEKDPSINTGVLVSNALATGVIEAGFELATRGVLKRAGILSNQGNAKAAKDLIRGGSESLIKGLGINTASEAGSEALTRTSTLLLDAAMLPGRDFDLGRDWKLIAEDAIVGSVFGISGTGVGAVRNRNVDAVQAAEYVLMPDQVKNVVEESGKKISELYKDKASAEPEGVALIDEAIELETARILNIKKQNSRALNDMTPNEVRSYANNKSKINELKSTINKSGQKDVVKKLAEDKLKTLQEVNKTLFKESSDRRVERNIQSVEKIAKGVEGLTFKPLENSEAVSEFIKENNIDVDNKKASEEQGFIYQNPETGAQTIIINKDVSKKQKAVNIAGHEFLHAVLFNTVKGSPETQIALGESLSNYINNIDTSKIKNSNFAERLKQYKDSDKATQSEEVLTLFSDALTSGDIKFNENVFTKIGDVIRRALQSIGIKVKFNEGRDVYNFVKDYNKSVAKGKLTKTQEKATAEGIEGELVKPKVKTTDETIVKEAKSEEASQEVQRIYDEQGVAGAFDILEKFKPITNKIVERRRDAPNFDKQLLTDEIETGKRGIFDLIKEYKPESGVPLAAYINKFLPARAIEASKRVLGEEFTDDVTEAKGVAAEEVVVDAKDKPVKKISPKKLKTYTGVVASNLGVSGSEVSNVIDKAIETDLKTKPIKTFGESRNIGTNLAKTLGKAFGLNPEVFTKKTRNIQKKELDGLRNLRQFLDNNAAKDFSLLPDAYAGPSTIEGKSTFIPNNILNALYRKNDKGKWEKDPTKTVQDYKDLLGKIDGSVYRAAEAQTIKGLAAMSFRNLIVEKAAETAEPKARVDIKAGAKFSKAKEFKKLTKGLSDIQVAQEVLAIQKISEELGIEPRDVLLNINDNISKYKKLRGLLNIKEGGKKNITSVENSEKLKSTYKFFIKDLIPKGKTFDDLPKSVQQAIVDSVGFGDTRITLGGRPLTYKEITNGVKGYSNLLKKVFGDDVIVGTGSDYSNSRAVFAPRNWGGFRRKVENIVLKEGVTPSEAKLQVEKLLSAEGSTVDETIKSNRELLNRGYSSLVNFVIKNKSKESLGFVADVLESQVNRATGLFKGMVPMTSFSMKPERGDTKNQNKLMHNEHLIELFNANKDFLITLDKFINGKISESVLRKTVKQNVDKLQQAVISERMRVQKDASGASVRDFVDPITFLGKDAVDQIPIGTYKLDIGKDFTGINMAEFIAQNLNSSQIQKIGSVSRNKLSAEGIMVRNILENYRDYVKTKNTNNNKAPNSLKFSKVSNKNTNQNILNNLGNIDKALSIARNADAPIKKIRVFDFDDTLARSKSRVVYEMPDGKTGFLTATEFANKAGEMEANGATFDFSEFSKVIDGKKGPLLDIAKFINDAKGERDVFVLTARPQDAAGPIKEFLDSMGLNIPLENITGLGDGTAQAKARWMVDKAAEGYNDFYFADDATKNVKAVRDALSVLDVKSKVQQAYVKFSKPSKLNKDFNDIIEGATGIASEKVYGKAKAQVAGASRGKVFRGIAYSAQDFVGLLYETLGKGKEGDAQMAWYKQNLLDPYARAMNDLSSARLAMMNDYRALKKQLGIVPKNLRKKIPGEPWTREQAVRVYVWSKQGTEVPGISKNDLKDLNSFVANNAELQVFADQLMAIQKGDMYPEPGESWVSGSISTDMLRGLNTIKRVKYLEQWQANVDAIFSKENKNKLEAAYGINYVKALENSLQRMKTGRNRSFSDDSLTGRFTDWLQGSVGAIMFFNTRSAILQTLSAVNFVNFTDNNPYAAAKAFGNQKQYWKDFTTLMNSDFLKERRSGLRINVSEADIADMAKQEGPRGVINKLLQLGFAPTQIADSFAIASGGATFYRNRAKTYMKEGMDQAQAEEKAFQDFRENAEESQQSSRPDKISAQQAGPLGRLILAFANTPAQYARLTDKAIRDLKNSRGDAKTNISKIIYYTTVQNIIFNAVQQALFAMAFGDEEPEDEKKQEKYVSIANGMADSLLRGTGIAGSVISVGKNAIIRIIKESKKKRPKYEKVGYELLKISPPISAKISRINQAARAYEWNKKEMMTKGFSLDNPAFLAGGNVVSALTNIPLDRVVKKINNVVKATESDMELWERVALFAGWQDWELGIKEEEKPKKRKLIKRKQTFKTRKFKTRKFN